MSLADPSVEFVTDTTIAGIKKKVNKALCSGCRLVGPIQLILPFDKKDPVVYTATLIRNL
jgi:hypothetical protein